MSDSTLESIYDWRIFLIIGVISVLSFPLWWNLSHRVKHRWQLHDTSYFIWVMLSAPVYAFLTWWLLTFLAFSLGTLWLEGWHDVWIVVLSAAFVSLPIGGSFGVIIGGPIGFMIAGGNFVLVQRKEKRKKKQESLSFRRKVLASLLLFIMVFVVDLCCVWMIFSIYRDEMGELIFIFLFGGFTIVFIGFLVIAHRFKTKLPVVVHLFMFPFLFVLSSLLYSSYLDSQYNQQFQPLRELQQVEILSEILYQDDWGHGGYTQFKAFLVRCEHDEEELEQVVRQALILDSLRRINDFSFSSTRRKKNTAIQLKVTSAETLHEDTYQQLAQELDNQMDILNATDYVIQFFYDVEIPD